MRRHIEEVAGGGVGVWVCHLARELVFVKIERLDAMNYTNYDTPFWF